MKRILTCVSLALIFSLAGCSTMPFMQEIALTDPATGELVLDRSGSPIVLKQRRSQRTLQLDADVSLIAMQLQRESDVDGTADFKPDNCGDIQPPTGSDGMLYMAYAMAIGNCASAGGGNGLDYRTVAAIQGKSHIPSVQMFGEQQKTVRHQQEMRERSKDRWLNVGGLVTTTLLELEKLDNGGGVGSGGTFVKGDVIVSQRQSNSGGADALAAAAGAEGEGSTGAASGGATGAQNRLAGMTVFGNTNGAIVTDNAKSSSTAYGPNQLLETSATGMATLDSVNKGTVVADEQNAGNQFDDNDVTAAFDL